MTREQYIRMTERTRGATEKLPGGAKCLHAPTLLCAACYLLALLWLALRGDARLIRAMAVPAACFVVVTILRPIIGRQRPYDRFAAVPVGSYKPGKGKSMPSRHTASAAAIAFALVYLFPGVGTFVAAGALCLLIAGLRVVAGQHYPSDVMAALVISAVISCVGYLV